MPTQQTNTTNARVEEPLQPDPRQPDPDRRRKPRPSDPNRPDNPERRRDNPSPEIPHDPQDVPTQELR